ncbi:MAG: type IV secretion system DNA-binding domain-containing protein, partial [Gammaproteobacteria bacterium]|nr:type IV secretion system DNA-binding domain-containing protein [Gammaproteobacteria bacterium]MYG66073.1 type IV secretion system DNA-binding domain-containing protein [Gammaproteobacteria bacterium]
LDELPTLHQVPSLQPGLAESRQFGGCFVLGVQVISALRDLYGRNGAETISGLCGTRVVLGSPDRDTAQWSADCLGRSEVEEMSEGLSYGANTIRDGVSLTPKRELRALALASEIMRLQNLNGYLRFPGPLPVARIRLDYAYRPRVADRFVSLKCQKEGERKVVGSDQEPGPEHEIGSTREIPVDAGSEGPVNVEMPVDTKPEESVTGELAVDTEQEGGVTLEILVGDEAEENPMSNGLAHDGEVENPSAGGRMPDPEVKGVVI